MTNRKDDGYRVIMAILICALFGIWAWVEMIKAVAQ